MRNITFLLALMLIFGFNTFSQEIETVTVTTTVSSENINPVKKFYHSVRVRQGVDTTNVTFKEILEFWKNYQDDLVKREFLKDTSVNTNKYWADSEILRYKNPDLILQLPSVHFLLPEYVIGIEKRNDTLYEIKSVYYSNFKPENEIVISFSILVSKVRDKYKLYNRFTFNASLLNNLNFGWIQFYYTNTYKFNKVEAKYLFQRANKLALEWGVKNTAPIKYYLFPTYTEILNGLGVSIGVDDYISSNVVRDRGFALAKSRQIFYTQGGENLLHEIIHILIYDLRNNNEEYYIDEGICCYFGEHGGKPYDFHAKRLKSFLNENPQINLGISLVGAYKDNNGKYTHDTIWKIYPFDEGKWYTDDTTTNFMYMIMGTICEIAYKKGGMDLIKQMILNPQKGDELYNMIEKYLGIKRKDINAYIRDYLNATY